MTRQASTPPTNDRGVGPVGYPSGGSVFLGSEGGGFSSRPFAEQTQAAVDAEVSRLLTEAQAKVVEFLNAHRSQLDQLVSISGPVASTVGSRSS